jgi:hypothetical protein
MGLCKERSLLAVERPYWNAVFTATPNMLQNIWTEFGHSLDIVVSPGVPALKYTKVGCSQKNILGLLFVTVQTGLMYNEHISRYKSFFLGSCHQNILYYHRTLNFVSTLPPARP